MERFGIVIKSASGRFLSAAARCAIRLEVGLLGRSASDVGERYGITPQRVGRMTKSIPSYGGSDASMNEVIATARTYWKNESGRRSSEAGWTLVLLDALALAIGDPRLSSSAFLNAAIAHAGVGITAVLEENHHVG